MEKPTLTLGCDGKEYLVIDGTWYHKDTPIRVIEILENCRRDRREYRLYMFYGDVKTGEAWIDPDYCTLESDICSAGEVGYIGRSMGKIKIPLAIFRSNSWGGPGLLEHCIVKIVTARGKRVLYQHENFHLKESENQKAIENRLAMVGSL